MFVNVVLLRSINQSTGSRLCVKSDNCVGQALLPVHLMGTKTDATFPTFFFFFLGFPTFQ